MTEQQRWTTPKGIVSFPHVFKPNSFQGKEKYEISLLVPADVDLKVLKAAVIAAAKDKFGKHPKDIKNWQSPFKDGNIKFSDDEEKYAIYEDKIVLTARSEYQPGVVDQKKQEIIDEEEFYAGCQGRMSVNLYGWTFGNKNGVSFGLVAAQKMAEGEKLGGGRPDASNLFDDETAEDTGSGDGFDGDYDV